MDQPSANSTIFRNPLPANSASDIKKDPVAWGRKNIVRIILVLLVIGVILELIFGGMSLFAPSKTGNLNPLAPKANGLTEASLSFVPDKASYKSGDAVEIDVKLFTGGYSTDSTDLVVKYDPAFLAPKATFAEAGSVYSEYPALQLDKKNNVIGISGITVPGKESFNGAGVFAKLYFTAVKDGQTQVNIDYQQGATADSNVVLSGSTNDILGLTQNADILINGTDSAAAASKSCGNFRQACIDSAGNSGVQACTGGSDKSGSCGYDARLTTSCGECK